MSNELVEALGNIAEQNLCDEMEQEDMEGADFVGAYGCVIKVARKALAAHKAKPDGWLAEIIEADFHKQTVTFKMPKDFEVMAGEYFIRKQND